jgi:hypothetical protein
MARARAKCPTAFKAHGQVFAGRKLWFDPLFPIADIKPARLEIGMTILACNLRLPAHRTSVNKSSLQLVYPFCERPFHWQGIVPNWDGSEYH